MVKTQLLLGVNNMCDLSVQTDFHKELSFVFNTHYYILFIQKERVL